jgi:hypothetical protein
MIIIYNTQQKITTTGLADSWKQWLSISVNQIFLGVGGLRITKVLKNRI